MSAAQEQGVGDAPARRPELTGEKLLKHLARAARKHHNLTVREWKPGPVGKHSEHSYHCKTFPDGVGRAFDASGPKKDMNEFARAVRVRHGKHLTEGIHKPNLSIKNGKRVDPSFWDKDWDRHGDHIHIAI